MRYRYRYRSASSSEPPPAPTSTSDSRAPTAGSSVGASSPGRLEAVFRGRLEALDARGLRRVPRIVGEATEASSPTARWDLTSNDYLGLSTHPSVRRAVAEAALEFGTWRSSPVVGGYSVHHRRLEEALMRLKGTEECMLFSSGFSANVGVMTALDGLGFCFFSVRRWLVGWWVGWLGEQRGAKLRPAVDPTRRAAGGLPRGIREGESWWGWARAGGVGILVGCTGRCSAPRSSPHSSSPLPIRRRPSPFVVTPPHSSSPHPIRRHPTRSTLPVRGHPTALLFSVFRHPSLVTQ